MLQLYASMLHERRIIITSSKLSTVSTSHFFQAEYIEHLKKTLADLNMFSRYLWDNIYILLKIYGFNLTLEAQKSDLYKAFSDTLSQVNYFLLSGDESSLTR